jgi:hypothetical protein
MQLEPQELFVGYLYNISITYSQEHKPSGRAVLKGIAMKPAKYLISGTMSASSN